MALSTPQLTEWLRNARFGEWLAYWNGYLAQDRTGSADIERRAALAYRAYEAGQVTLVQKREGPSRWVYFMVRI